MVAAALPPLIKSRDNPVSKERFIGRLPMRVRQRWLGGALGLLAAALMSSGAQAQAALTGLVSSSEEGAMEGVLVSAKKEGSTITTTVVTDGQGRYSFPAARLEAGKYTISIRAIGYKPGGPQGGRRPHGQYRHGRSQARQSQEPGAATLQRGMVAQPSRRRQAEGLSDDVRGLPHASAGVDLEPRRRRIPTGIFAHGALLARQHAHASATAAARSARRAPGGHRRCRQSGARISRNRQPRQSAADPLSPQAASPSQGPLHQSRHHGIRSPTQGRASARRHRR